MHFGGGDSLIAENRLLLPLFVANGIAAVRDAAGDLSSTVLAWRDSVARGELGGPRIFTSGPKLEGINSIWPGDLEVGSRAEVDAGLDSLQAMHVDFVKLTDNTLDPDLFRYALGEIAKRGLRSSAHIPARVPVREAVQLGLGSIEHLSYAIRAGTEREGALPSRDVMTDFDEATALATYRLMAERGTAITPTLNISRVLAWLDSEDHSRDEYLRYIGPGLQATYRWRVERAATADSAAVARRHRLYDFTASKLPLLQQAGVLILAGTDAGFLNSYDYPGRGLHDELELLVKAGLTPLQALQAATINGARFLGHEDRHGTLELGRAADILVLDRNPLTDIRATRAIHALVLRGAYLDRSALDTMLADVARQVRLTSSASVAVDARPSLDPSASIWVSCSYHCPLPNSCAMSKFASLLAAALLAAPAAPHSALLAQSHSPLIGRWDLVIDSKDRHKAGWLEVRHSGVSMLVGAYVGTTGSARPISKVDFKDGTFSFTIPPQWNNAEGDNAFTGQLKGDSITGTISYGNGKSEAFRGARAPTLRRAAAPVWGAPVKLLAGKDLSGWTTLGEAPSQWELVGGVLHNKKSGADLVTEKTLRRLQAARGVPLPEGEQQRDLPARPLRSAGRGHAVL